MSNWTYADEKMTVVVRVLEGGAIQSSYASTLEPGTPIDPYVPPPGAAREAAKQARALAVDNIQVTTAAGNTFDGDEASQGRMARAIIALSTGLAPSVNWVLADNSVIQATANELTEALVLAGLAQAAIWVIPE